MPKSPAGIMHEFKQGKLHSGSKKGPKVTNRKQAIAIALNQKPKPPAAPPHATPRTGTDALAGLKKAAATR